MDRTSVRISRLSVLLATAATTVLATVAAPATAAVAAPSGATTSTNCTPSATRLHDLGYGGEAFAFAGSTVVGQVYDGGGSSHPAIWRRGVLSVLDDATIANGTAYDVNALGEVVGTADGFSLGWVLHPSGLLTLLRNAPGADGQFVYAHGINLFGQVAGAAQDETFAARWPATGGTPTLLPPAPGDAGSFARAINDWGWVAGESDDANFVPRAAVWDPSGTVHLLAGVFAGDSSDLLDIADSGLAAGESYLSGDFGPAADQATLWSRNGVPHGLGYLPGDNLSFATSVADNGFVAGISQSWDYVNQAPVGANHGIVWPGHGPLLTVPVPGLGYDASESALHQIGWDGTAVGAAGRSGGPDSAYVWRCVFAQAFQPATSHARSSRVGSASVSLRGYPRGAARPLRAGRPGSGH
jgi:uncharacterized membrane protein